MYLLLVFLIFFAGFVNSAYSLLRHKWVGRDTFYHLWLGGEIRKLRRLPEQVERYPFPEPYNLPLLPHILLALFPERYHQKLQLLAPILLMINGILLYFVCQAFFNPQIAMMSVALYFFIPMTRDNYYSLTARAFGDTFLIISLLSLFVFYMSANYVALLISILASSFVFLSHRLTLQSFTAVLIALTIFLRSYLPSLVFIFGMLLAVIFTGGYYLKILKWHLELIFHMARNITNPKIRAVTPEIYLNPIRFLFNIPVLVMLPFFFFSGRGVVNDFFLIWTISLVVLSVIWFLGEGYRHAANATIPLAVLTAIWTYQQANYLIFFGFLAICLVFTLVKIVRLEKDRYSILPDSLITAFYWLKNNCRKEELVLCLPFDIFQALYYFTGCRILQAGGWEAKGIIFNRYVLSEKVKPENLGETIKEYSIKYILTMNKESLPGETVFSSGEVKINKL